MTNETVMPAKAGIHCIRAQWPSACAGVTGGSYVGTLSFSVIPVTVRFVLLCHRERMRGDDKGVVSVSSIPLSLLRRQEWDYTVRVKRAKNQTLYNTE